MQVWGKLLHSGAMTFVNISLLKASDVLNSFGGFCWKLWGMTQWAKASLNFTHISCEHCFLPSKEKTDEFAPIPTITLFFVLKENLSFRAFPGPVPCRLKLAAVICLFIRWADRGVLRRRGREQSRGHGVQLRQIISGSMLLKDRFHRMLWHNSVVHVFWIIT